MKIDWLFLLFDLIDYLREKSQTLSFTIYLDHLSPSNLTAYVVNAHTLSLTWDLPSNTNEINRIFITVIELGSINRTIQMQSFDSTIKKIDLPINNHDSASIHTNRTIYFAAQTSNRHGQNSSLIDTQLFINTISKSCQISCVNTTNRLSLSLSLLK